MFWSSPQPSLQSLTSTDDFAFAGKELLRSPEPAVQDWAPRGFAEFCAPRPFAEDAAHELLEIIAAAAHPYAASSPERGRTRIRPARQSGERTKTRQVLNPNPETLNPIRERRFSTC